MAEPLLIGCHVHMRGPDYLLGSLKEALAYNASTFMIYTGAPQNAARKPISALKLTAFNQLLATTSIKKSQLVIHAPYLINLANTLNPQVFKNSVALLNRELDRAVAIGIMLVVLHPGSKLAGPLDASLKQVAQGLNQVLKSHPQVKIALETMAGKGSEIGTNFQQLKTIIDLVDYPDQVGVCWDTCHLNDAGYDLKQNFESVWAEFKTIIGAEKLLALHINDALYPLGSHKDRHQNLGYGTIGFEALLNIIYFPGFKNLPKILETPWVNDQSPYGDEIKAIRTRSFTNKLHKIKRK